MREGCDGAGLEPIVLEAEVVGEGIVGVKFGGPKSAGWGDGGGGEEQAGGEGEECDVRREGWECELFV